MRQYIVAALALAVSTAAWADPVALDYSAAVAAPVRGGSELIPIPFKTADGHEGWSVRLGTQPLSTPAYANGLVYIGGGFMSHSFVALRAGSGESKWKLQTRDNGPTSPVADENIVAMNTESCTTEVYDASTGKPVWLQMTGHTLTSVPMLLDDILLVGHPFMMPGDRPHRPNSLSDRRWKMLSVNPRTGEKHWDADVTDEVLTAPVCDGKVAIFGCFDGMVFALRTSDGKALWMNQYQCTAAPLIAGEYVFLTQRGEAGGRTVEGVKRYTLAGGKPVDTEFLVAMPNSKMPTENGGPQNVWNYQGSKFAAGNGRVIGAIGSVMSGLQIKDGKLLWQVAAGVRFLPPALGKENVYAVTEQGMLVTFRQSDGKVQSIYDLGHPASAQPILAEGNVYVPTADGLLICLKTGGKDADGWYAWGGNARHNKVN